MQECGWCSKEYNIALMHREHDEEILACEEHVDKAVEKLKRVIKEVNA